VYDARAQEAHVNTEPAAPADPGEKLRAAFGRNAGHYLKHLERLRRADRTWLPGWNVAAFLHSTGWLWYRRMYGWSILNLIAPVLLLLLLIFVVQWFVPEGGMGYAMAAAGVAYLFLSFVLVPAYADSLYLYRLKRNGKLPAPPSAWTGFGALLVIVVPALMVYVSAEAQYEYYGREQVAEAAHIAASLRTPVAEFYRAQRRLPGPSEAPQFRHAEKLKYTASVGWDAGRGAIVATMDGRFKGRQFEFVAVEKGDALAWTCRPIDLDPQYLRADCR
jgi:hypothetical protein